MKKEFLLESCNKIKSKNQAYDSLFRPNKFAFMMIIIRLNICCSIFQRQKKIKSIFPFRLMIELKRFQKCHTAFALKFKMGN